jgi:carboxypeptidase Taq
MQAQAAYDELVRRAREETLLGSCAQLLGWDEETFMPPAGVDHRGNQMALLAGLQHERATDPRIGELLGELEGSALVRDPVSPAAVNVREIRRLYDRLTRLPRSLVRELARTATFAQQEWVVARQKADFDHFQPWLERIVRLKRLEADALGYEVDPYDALLDEYEPGAKSQQVARLFDALRRDLVPLVETITGSPRRPDAAVLHHYYPLERQRIFCEAAAAALGFDFERGRLDTAVHPFFIGIGPDDCRLSTRYQQNDFCEGFFGTLHEVGHGFYELGLDPEHYGTPMGEAVSLGLHESQARLWENAVGRSRPFWEHFFPRARQVFHQVLADVTLEQFHAAVNAVEPSVIRVRADEVTYNLHILIRFELERALVSGDLKPADLPAAWDEGYRRYLGLTPANDREGCLQDGHWSGGLIGYFPTYTLGNLFAAQLFARAAEELSDLDGHFARGEFAELHGWLRDKVYRQGHRYPAARLIEHVTGSPPDQLPLIQGLRQKYGELYGIRKR